MGTESYPYIAVQNIFAGNVMAYAAGDPVPESNAHDLGYLDAGWVVPRSEFNPQDPAAEGQPLRRGEMPPHLAAKSVSDESKVTPKAKAKADN